MSWSASAVLHCAGQLVMKAATTWSQLDRLLPVRSLLTSPIYCMNWSSCGPGFPSGLQPMVSSVSYNRKPTFQT